MVLGRVVDGTTGVAISGVRVVMFGLGRGSDSFRVTDNEGRFVYFNMPKGKYRLKATKSGYTAGEFGLLSVTANRPIVRIGDVAVGTQPIVLGEGELQSNVVVRLWRLGTITGRVVDETGEPVIDAVVQAWPKVSIAGRTGLNSVLPATGRTDDRGVYRISEIVEGEYVVVVPAVALTTPEDWKLPVRSNATSWHPDLFRLWQAFDWTGTYESVFPEAGRARVVATGGWIESRVANPATPAPEHGRRLQYAATFYPGVLTGADATLLRVTPGIELAGIDIGLRPVESRIIAGVVRGPKGATAGVALRLISASQDGTSFDAEVAVSIADRSGAFRFSSVPSGSYRIDVLDLPRIRGPSGFTPDNLASGVVLMRWPVDAWSAAETLWASESLVVGDSDVFNLVLELRRGARIGGRVVFEGSSPAPQNPDLFHLLELDRAGGQLSRMEAEGELTVGPSLEFRTVGLPPGKYFIRAPRAQGAWSLESVMFQGRDLSVTPLELGSEDITGILVTFVDRPNMISGTVRTADGMPDPDATVFCFPIDPGLRVDYGYRPRNIVAVRVDPTGAYALQGIPAGEYAIVAADDRAWNDWNHAGLFEALGRRADRIRVTPRSVQTIDLVTRHLQR
jgi:hypothetical protein